MSVTNIMCFFLYVCIIWLVYPWYICTNCLKLLHTNSIAPEGGGKGQFIVTKINMVQLFLMFGKKRRHIRYKCESVSQSVSQSVSLSFRNTCVHVLSKCIVASLKLTHFVGMGLLMNPIDFGHHTPAHASTPGGSSKFLCTRFKQKY